MELDTDDELDMLDLNVHSVDCSVRLHVRPFYFIGLSLVHNLHYVSMSKSKLMLDYENTILKCKHSELIKQGPVVTRRVQADKRREINKEEHVRSRKCQ